MNYSGYLIAPHQLHPSAARFAQSVNPPIRLPGNPQVRPSAAAHVHRSARDQNVRIGQGPGDVTSSTLDTIVRVASVAGAAGGAYHGYVRHHDSLGWALIWGILGGAFPIFTIPIAIAQGFGQPGDGKSSSHVGRRAHK